jgi:hypothetical protein
MAEQYEADARRAMEAGDSALAALKREIAGACRDLAGALKADPVPRLPKREQKRRVVTKPMVDDHRLAISAGRAKQERSKQERSKPGGGAKAPKAANPFIDALNAAGFSLRSLAPQLHVKPSTISAHRLPKGHPDSRAIPRERAVQIRRLTGWPDDARHWPCGIAD